MKKIKQKIKSLTFILLAAMICSLSITAAWAAVSLIKTEDASHYVSAAKKADIPVKTEQQPKSRAPEPATMALFGGGFLGMIAGFIRKTYRAAKRVFDICAAIAGTIILSPILIGIAILTKLTSKGPLIYSQVRVGKDGKNFKMYKFRTMKVDAEKETGPVWAAENDSRLTPIGGFLRKTHVDELPQLLNILKGEMSLIGPRPERPLFVEQFKEKIPNYEHRLRVQPGLTGLAQVWHRYDESIEDVKKKLKYDLLYVKKMCFWADISIILRTFRVVVTGEGAR